MRFRLGMMLGGAVGYVLGTRAGRQRYEQIKRLAGRLRQHPAYQQIRDQVTGVTDLTRIGVARGLRAGSDGLRAAADDTVTVTVTRDPGTPS